jgi:hypothetical protein
MRTTAAIALAALAAGCGPKVPCEEPEEVVSKLFGSLQYGDTGMAFELISAADRKALRERAPAAAPPGGKAPQPHELLVPGLVDLPGDISAAQVKPRRVEVGDVTEVEVRFGSGTLTVIPVVKEAGCYRVPLGLSN